jgi:hypothetical protein
MTLKGKRVANDISGDAANEVSQMSSSTKMTALIIEEPVETLNSVSELNNAVPKKPGVKKSTRGKVPKREK